MTAVRDRGFKEVTGIEAALALLFGNLQQKAAPSEKVSVSGSLNRVVAQDVVAPINIPQVDRAAMDGYAVLAKNTFGASSTNPVMLDLVGESFIGQPSSLKLQEGWAVSVSTGSVMPAGADAVVMVEYVKKLDERSIEVRSAVAPGENLARTGEDLSKGSTVLSRGLKIRPVDIGVMTAVGIRKVTVVKKPRVAVISTGNELVKDSSRLRPETVIDVNRPTIASMIEEAGGSPVDLGIARDDPGSVRRKLQEALERADFTIISGGSSVGSRDIVPDIVNSLGKPGMLVHGVALRPSLPTGLGVIYGKPVLCLPGYPVSAIIAFKVFGYPIIFRMLGCEADPEPRVKARLTRRVPTPPGLRTFLRVVVEERDGAVWAEPLRQPGAGVLTSLSRANGMVVVPEEREGYEEGEEVDVALLRPIRKAR